MYEPNLVKVVDHIRVNTIKRLNKSKKWKYGYNKEHDVIVISRNGQIGDVIEIQNLKIALPNQPKKIHKFQNDKWQVTPYPKELKNIKTIFDWRDYPNDFKEKYVVDSDFPSKISEYLTEAIEAKFSKEELKNILLATKDAKIVSFARANTPPVMTELMEVRKSMS